MKNFKRGDTLIEVLLAFSVFSMVMIVSIALINLGVARTQASLQVTMTRNAMDNQAEALRFLNNAYLADRSAAEANIWRDIKGRAVSQRPSTNLNQCPSQTELQNGFFSRRFAIDEALNVIRRDGLFPARTFATINAGRAEGIWIEPVAPAARSGYYDFYIYACWQAPGSNVPTTLGTIVRLYDPEQ